MAKLLQESPPLAYRVRPKTLGAFVGQEHIVGIGTPLQTMLERGECPSIILAGPPGTGKTTLAEIIANTVQAQFIALNAVLSGVRELRDACQTAATARKMGEKTIMFIDEIHRFNKSQQDALLPYVENGTLTLIGATTANPYFEVNAALLSRMHVYLLQPLSQENITTILRRTLGIQEGYAGKAKVSEKAIDHLATIANGDARIALSALELSVTSIGMTLDIQQMRTLWKHSAKRYDQKGDDHYDTISAFIKSMRGSDGDAALIWLFKMLTGGEDPRFLFRRMMVFASEDIGNADPQALQSVVNAWQAFELVGLPEGEYFLAHACTYLSQAPKSNAIKRAIEAVKKALSTASQLEVPNHLRNTPFRAMQDHGHGIGYIYPHDEPEGIAAQKYFPIGLIPQEFYKPSERGYEKTITERMKKIRSVLKIGR